MLTIKRWLLLFCKHIYYIALCHARIQEFSSEGGPGQSDQNSSDNVFFSFFLFFFLSPQLILQKSNGQFQGNISFFKVPEGVQHFPGGGGGPTFSRGGPIAYSL